MGIFSDRRVYCFCTSFGIAVVFKQATATEKIAYQHRSADQLRFIRSLLDLCYTYAESPVVFIDKFKDKVNIRELKSYDLIDTSDKQFSNLKEDERLLCMQRQMPVGPAPKMSTVSSSPISEMRQPNAQPPFRSVQLFTYPCRQKKQSPQKVSTLTVTRSPGLTVVTSAPTRSTTPTISCPTVIPGTARCTLPCLMCRSLVQMLASVTRTTASHGCSSSGFGFSRSSNRPRSM